MKVEVLGPGCPYATIAGCEVMSTPALVVDGEVVSVGRVLSPGDIAGLLSGE
jgi:predicted thioredoxin/glutaredoxin